MKYKKLVLIVAFLSASWFLIVFVLFNETAVKDVEDKVICFQMFWPISFLFTRFENSDLQIGPSTDFIFRFTSRAIKETYIKKFKSWNS